jgi:hypothetical protein
MPLSKTTSLAPTQFWTIFVAAIAASAAWHWIAADFALGLFLTALWALVGFRALEGILRAGVRPKGRPRDERALLFWAAVKLMVYGLAVWVLFSRPFPPLSHAVGFTLMMGVLVVVGARAGVRPPRADPRQEDDALSDEDPE